VEDFDTFVRESNFPKHWQVLGGMLTGKIPPENLRTLSDRMRARYHDDLGAFSREAGTTLVSWNRLVMTVPDWLSPAVRISAGPAVRRIQQGARGAAGGESGHPLRVRILRRSDRLPRLRQTRPRQAAGEIQRRASRAPPAAIDSRFRAAVARPAAEQAKFRTEWIEFVTKDLHPSFVRLDPIRVSPELYRKAIYREV
jgi:hypothetical protein